MAAAGRWRDAGKWRRLRLRTPDYRSGAKAALSTQVKLDIEDLSLEVFATNLTNKEYASGLAGNNEFYGSPQKFGIHAPLKL